VVRELVTHGTHHHDLGLKRQCLRGRAVILEVLLA